MEVSEKSQAAYGRFMEYLARSGRRFSVERGRLIEAICEMPKQFLLSDLLEYIKRHKNVYAYSTIYRNLSLLIDSGIITEYRDPDGRVAYVRGDQELLLVCVECGKVVCVPAEAQLVNYETLQCEAHGFLHLATHRVTRGICPDCRSNHPGEK